MLRIVIVGILISKKKMLRPVVGDRLQNLSADRADTLGEGVSGCTYVGRALKGGVAESSSSDEMRIVSTTTEAGLGSFGLSLPGRNGSD